MLNLLLIIMTLFVVKVIYCIRIIFIINFNIHFCMYRKYRSLEVRYTRLQQGPLRFTFTAEGENLDDDDVNDDNEEDDTMTGDDLNVELVNKAN